MPNIPHPLFPLMSTCRLVCLMHFALRPDTWVALFNQEYETVGELVEHYGGDFTAIWGIGPSRAGDLETVLAASRYVDVSGW